MGFFKKVNKKINKAVQDYESYSEKKANKEIEKAKRNTMLYKAKASEERARNSYESARPRPQQPMMGGFNGGMDPFAQQSKKKRKKDQYPFL